MKNLLLNAVEELMNRVDVQLEMMRKNIRKVETLNEKYNIVLEGRIEVINKLEKLDYLGQQLQVRFPEEINEVEYIERYIQKANLQLKDMVFIVNGMNTMIEA